MNSWEICTMKQDERLRLDCINSKAETAANNMQFLHGHTHRWRLFDAFLCGTERWRQTSLLGIGGGRGPPRVLGRLGAGHGHGRRGVGQLGSILLLLWQNLSCRCWRLRLRCCCCFLCGGRSELCCLLQWHGGQGGIRSLAEADGTPNIRTAPSTLSLWHADLDALWATNEMLDGGTVQFVVWPVNGTQAWFKHELILKKSTCMFTKKWEHEQALQFMNAALAQHVLRKENK